MRNLNGSLAEKKEKTRPSSLLSLSLSLLCAPNRGTNLASHRLLRSPLNSQPLVTYWPLPLGFNGFHCSLIIRTPGVLIR